VTARSSSRPSASRRRRRARQQPEWASWSDDEILELRFCDLGVRIEGILEERINMLYDELEERGLRFRPHFWLAEEWFSPDGVPGVAVPFYLAHRRLAQLERRQMFWVEGGAETHCLRILRHEAGHAIDTAYGLRRRRRWQRVFGRPSKPYPDYYRPRTYSQRYVLHLGWWYAQAHPTEDFAETFAVWLRSGSRWRSHYAGWPALRKLEYVDELMTEIADAVPLVRKRRHVEPITQLRKTLYEHYDEKRRHYRAEYPEVYDRDLRRVFVDPERAEARHSAAAFLGQVRGELRQVVARGTGEHPYTIDQVIDEMIVRCRELGLRLRSSKMRTKMEVGILLSVQIVNFLHTGRHRVPL
jgi:hypothetical protein